MTNNLRDPNGVEELISAAKAMLAEADKINTLVRGCMTEPPTVAAIRRALAKLEA